MCVCQHFHCISRFPLNASYRTVHKRWPPRLRQVDGSTVQDWRWNRTATSPRRELAPLCKCCQLFLCSVAPSTCYLLSVTQPRRWRPPAPLYLAAPMDVFPPRFVPVLMPIRFAFISLLQNYLHHLHLGAGPCLQERLGAMVIEIFDTCDTGPPHHGWGGQWQTHPFVLDAECRERLITHLKTLGGY